MLLSNYIPDFMIETNHRFLVDEPYTIFYDADKMWDGSANSGVSPYAASLLANRVGYSPLYTEKNCVNTFFVRRTVIAELLLNRTGIAYPINRATP
jgi:hypothetical protein